MIPASVLPKENQVLRVVNEDSFLKYKETYTYKGQYNNKLFVVKEDKIFSLTYQEFCSTFVW